MTDYLAIDEQPTPLADWGQEAAAPPPVNWSMDFTTIPGEYLFKHDSLLIRMFNTAFAERQRALSIGTPATWPPAPPAPGLDALNWWKGLRDTVNALAPSFVRYYDAGGARYQIAGKATIDSCRYTGQPSINSGSGFHPNGFTPIAFPYNAANPSQSGWSRRFTRLIYTVSQPNVGGGTRARFSAQPSNTWYAAKTTDLLFLAPVSTPPAEYKYSGKYFDWSGSAWVLSPDQISPADVISETGLIADNLPLGQVSHPGDYLDGQWLNELRDAINQLTTTLGSNLQSTLTGFVGAGLPGGGYTTANGAVNVSFYVTSVGSLISNEPAAGYFATDSTAASAQSDYALAVGGASFSGSPVPRYGQNVSTSPMGGQTQTNSIAGTYACYVCPGVIINDDNTLAAISIGQTGGGGLTRRASFWIWPSDPANNYPPSMAAWNAFGSGLTPGVWNGYGATFDSGRDASNPFFDPGTVGGFPNIHICFYSDGTAGGPGVTPSTFSTSPSTLGWGPFNLAISLDYEAPGAGAGGFKYVHGYAGT